jgi:hypothetical protein
VTVPVKDGGKGRPTPRRREVEQRNRRPVVGGAQGARPGATKEERRAAKISAREERTRARAAMLAGDERALPPRDRGPARRWTRDYVDARYNAGEYFMFVVVVALVLSFVNLPIATLVSMAVLYATFLVVAVDCVLLRRRVQRLANDRFGEKAAAGVGTYALMRSLQLRRGRTPRPQIPHGGTPR